jgi:sulfur carrier protein
MLIEINGEPRDVPTGATIRTLLESLGLSERPVAVERNTGIVPRVQHASTELREGDKLEIVQFVGGG